MRQILEGLMDGSNKLGGVVDAFICYSRDDKEAVSFIQQQLVERGDVSVFFDATSLSMGDEWPLRLQEMLTKCETFLIFIREAPTPWQLRELMVALDLQVKLRKPYIIPVLLPGLVDGAFFNNPQISFLWSAQAAQFSANVKDIEVIDGLIRAISGNSRVYINRRSQPRSDKLPSGFIADLERLTELLIGEAVYRTHDIGIRELIQNARDACTRLALATPQARTAEIIVSVNPSGNSFDVIDFGDGMSREVLASSFAVLGRSRSEDISAQQMKKSKLANPVIGKFGVGFISTFMIAERVSLSTKALDDDAHHISIASPKLPFAITAKSECGRDNVNDNGTTIRVHLKPDLKIDVAAVVRKYCRHVPGLFLQTGAERTPIESSWNVSDWAPVVSIATEDHEIRLGWAKERASASIILSNGGFFVCPLSSAVVGSNFPLHLLSGEVNVRPGFIDLNLSRDDIVDNEKLEALRALVGKSLHALMEASHAALSKPSTSPSLKGKAKLELGESLRTACAALFDGKSTKAQIGSIPFPDFANIKSVYADALATALATRGSDRLDVALKERILKGRLPIVILAKAGSDQKSTLRKHASVNRFLTVTLGDEEASLARAAKPLVVYSLQEGFDRFLGWNTLRGLLHRTATYGPIVLLCILAAIGVLAIAGAIWWLGFSAASG